VKYFTLLSTVIMLLVFSPAISQEKYTVQSDITFGYSVLSSDDNLFFNNHYDYSEGAFIENFDFSITSKMKSSWFDNFTVKARTGDRFDTGRKISLKLQKKGLYLFSISQRQDTDYFYNNDYNNGGNNRKLTRENLQVNFNWLGVKNFNLFTGYKQYSSLGNLNKPFKEWGDVFTLQMDKDISYDEVKVGFTYRKNALRLSVRQSWISVDDNSAYNNFQYTGTNNITLENPMYTGNVTSSIPTTFVKGSYWTEKISLSFTYTKKDGSIENNSIDLKNYYFEDYGSRTDKIVQLNGTSNNPITESTVFISYKPFNSFSLSYDLVATETETTTNMNGTNTINLYGTTSSPVVSISDSFQNSSYYNNSKVRHGLTAKYTPCKSADIVVSYHKTDGDIENSFINNETPDPTLKEDYSNDKLEFFLKYKFSSGSIKGTVFNEDIENPIYRTSGAKKDGYSFSCSFFATDKLSVNGLYSNMTTKDNSPDINLNADTSLYDLLISYSVGKGFAIGVGTTGIDYNNLIGLTYTTDETLTTELEDYDLSQKGYYAFANFEGDKRISAGFSIYFMDDTGSSFPMSNLIGKARVQIKLTKTVYAILAGSYFDYDEKNLILHNYNVNNLTVGFRWILK